MNTYPIFLIGLDKKRCVVIGSGAEAEHKLQGLLHAGAAVTLIAARPAQMARELADSGRIAWLARDYQPGDLRGAFLAIATERDPALVERVRAEAVAERVLLNVVDDPEHSDFIFGAVTRQGELTLAISTGGAAPALAVRLRQRFKREFGPEYAEFLDLLQALRDPLAARVPDFDARRSLWYALVDSDVLDLLRAGQREQARRRIAEIVGDIK